MRKVSIKNLLLRAFAKSDQVVVEEIFKLLPKSAQKRLIQASVAGLLLGLLDLFGVALIGVLGSLAVNGIRGSEQGDRVSIVLRIFHIENLDLRIQVALVAITALLLLLVRTGASVYLTRKTLHYLGRQGAGISANLFSKFMNSDLSVRNRRTSQETIFGLTTGITTSVLNIVGSLVTIFSDISLALILIIAVTVINPLTGLLTVFIFGGLAVFLFFVMKRKMTYLGFQEIDRAVKSHSTILGALNLFHEIHVRNLESNFTTKVFAERKKLAEISAERLFLPNISKYVFESALLVGTVVISAAQFITQDAPRAVAVMAVFLVAGSRIAPAMLRAQQASITIKSSLAGLHPLANLISDLRHGAKNKIDETQLSYYRFENTITFKNVTFKFDDRDFKILDDVNYASAGPKTIAIVGNSGAGKTTFVDLLLGLRQPTVGKIEISGLDPNSAIKLWPGKIGYVPQETTILNASVAQNITLDLESESFNESNMEHALRAANLEEWANQLPSGLFSKLNEDGSDLSGGQRQRIGIARALYSRPELLILDEATSSLDPISESEITESIVKISKEACVIIIAHRLSSIRGVDEIIYLKGGQIAARGTFDELRRDFKDFEKQAQAMGL